MFVINIENSRKKTKVSYILKKKTKPFNCLQ